MGIDELGVDKMGVDEMGSRRSGMTPAQVHMAKDARACECISAI